MSVQQFFRQFNSKFLILGVICTFSFWAYGAVSESVKLGTYAYVKRENGEDRETLSLHQHRGNGEDGLQLT